MPPKPPTGRNEAIEMLLMVDPLSVLIVILGTPSAKEMDVTLPESVVEPAGTSTVRPSSEVAWRVAWAAATSDSRSFPVWPIWICENCASCETNSKLSIGFSGSW